MRNDPRISAKKLSVLISALYDTAVDAAQWPTFLAKLNLELGAEKSSVVAHRFFSETSGSERLGAQLYQVGYDPESVRLYNRHYGSSDPYATGFVERNLKLEVGVCSDLVKYEILRQGEFYNDYLRKVQVFYLSWIAVATPGRALALSFARPEKRKPFARTHLELLSVLAPHVKQALFLSSRFDALRTSAASAVKTVRAFNIAVASIDVNRRIIEMSSALEAMLTHNNSVRVRDKSFVLGNSAEQCQFDFLLKSAVNASKAASLRSDEANNEIWQAADSSNPSVGTLPGALAIPETATSPGLQIVIVPFISSLALADDPPAALVFFCSRSKRSSSIANILRQLYNLTPSEAKLAEKIRQGIELQAAADELGITKETARDRLKVIFQKTGTSRQVQLSNVLIQLPSE